VGAVAYILALSVSLSMGFKDPKPIVLEDGPWHRMRDNYAPTSRVQGALGLCQNCYPVAPDAGGAVLGRPGYTGLGAQLGSPGARTVQGYKQFKKKDGTSKTVKICGGKFYTLDWATRVWTEVLTAANLAAATGGAVSLSTTARVSFLNFADVLVVSDGVNTPFYWDGTVGGGVTKMTNAPIFYGPLTTYYGRLMGIKATDRATFVWSEVLQPNTGYEMVGYSNAWTLTQTDTSALMRLIGTNDQLVVMRARSATAATGKVDVNFSSSGTREGVAEAEGTSSPWAIIQTEKAMCFLDSDLRPQLARTGGNLIDIWEDLYETIRQLPKTQAQSALAVNYTPASLFLFAVCDLGSTDPNLILVFNGSPDVPVPVGVWRGFSMTALEMVENAAGEPRLLHGYNGYSYEHGNPEDSIWDDFDATGTNAIEHIIESQPLGFDLKREMLFDRIDLSLYTASAMSVDVNYETPRGSSAVQQIAVTGGGAVWDSGLWDGVSWATSSQEEHKALGILGEGRWIKCRFRHKLAGQEFGLNSFAVTAYPANTDPGVP
jgi:hypothetical protein